MKIGFVGLGRMGMNMVLNLLDRKRHTIVAWNRSPEKTKQAAKKGAIPAFTLEALVRKLPKKKVVWLMVPAGNPVDAMIAQLLPHLKRGDIIVDGGNSFYRDSIRRHNALRKKGIGFLDCGTSGGMEGARHGACMMIGGERKVFRQVEALFRDLCVKDGYGYMGKAGAGHFVKMVHNGIEYGMMGAINEGMEVIKKHSSTFGIDLKTAATVYAHGSIIESRLMRWLLDSFTTRGYLEHISCEVPQGETEKEMAKLEKLGEMKVLHTARMMRVRSRKKGLCCRYVAAMRNQFGGHKVKKK